MSTQALAAALLTALVVPSVSAPTVEARSRAECLDEAGMWFGLLVVTAEMDRFPPRLIVREAAWKQLSWNDKSAVAEVLNCGLAPDGMTVRNLQYIGDSSGQTLAIWDGLKLRYP